jgi:hypothetical protein
MPEFGPAFALVCRAPSYNFPGAQSRRVRGRPLPRPATLQFRAHRKQYQEQYQEQEQDQEQDQETDADRVWDV